MKPLPRRTLLRGVGACLGLPVLEAMLDRRGRIWGAAQAQSAAPPIRLGAVFIPNGVAMSNWRPKTEGYGYAVTPILAPIAAYQDRFNVLTGLQLGTPSGDDQHNRGTAGFATGRTLSPGNVNSPGPTGPSVDQVIAQKFKTATRFASLVVNCAPRLNEYNLPTRSYISWSATNTPVQPIRQPIDLYRALFATSVTVDNSALLRRRRVLDYVHESAVRLKGQLGAADRIRVDAHLNAVEEIENDLQLQLEATRAPPGCTQPAQPSPAAAFLDRARLLMDLLAMAITCDLTRYFSVMVGNGGDTHEPSDGPTVGLSPGTTVAGGLGFSNGQHAKSHQFDEATMTLYNVLHMKVFARLMEKLNGVVEGNGRTILDNSVIMLGSELGGAPGNHQLTDFPLVLAGRAGGAIKTGRHLVYANAPTTSALMLAMLNHAGLPVSEFGVAREPLTGLGT